MTLRKFLRLIFYRRRVQDDKQFKDSKRLALGMKAVNSGRKW